MVVLIPLALIGIVPELVRVRTIVWRIDDVQILREMVAAPVPEPMSHPAHPVCRWRFLRRRL